MPVTSPLKSAVMQDSSVQPSPKKLKLEHDKLMIAKMSENATIPTRGSPLAAGYDLYSAEVRFILIYLAVLESSFLGHYDSCSRQGSG